MVVLAVDDTEELPRLIGAIKEAAEGKIIRACDSDADALEFARDCAVWTAFINVEMRGNGGDGLALARKLRGLCPAMNIVFVAASGGYALASYEVCASDYILKPVTAAKVAMSLRKLRNPRAQSGDTRVRVHTFGNFEVFAGGKPVVFNRTKAKEAFAYLVDRLGSVASTAEIAATIWEDKEYNRTMQKYTQTILKSMLDALCAHGIADVIIRRYNSYCVDRQRIECDYYELLDGGASSPNAYNGEYMSNYSWAETTNGYLMQKYIK